MYKWTVHLGRDWPETIEVQAAMPFEKHVKQLTISSHKKWTIRKKICSRSFVCSFCCSVYPVPHCRFFWFSSAFNVHNFIVVMLICCSTMVIIAYLIHFYSFITVKPVLFYYSHSSSERENMVFACILCLMHCVYDLGEYLYISHLIVVFLVWDSGYMYGMVWYVQEVHCVSVHV